MKAAIAATMLGVATFALRMLALVGLPNDHFISLTRGAQVLLGEWPVRDFVEPGAPLTTLTTAAVQAIGGRSLLSEAVFVAGVFGLAAALTVLVLWGITGSVLLGTWAAITEVVAYPRTYGWPKILLYVAAAGAFAWYARSPRTATRLALAAVVAIAFLFRHDHGLLIGAGAAAAVLATHRGESAKAALTAVWWLAVAVIVLTAPYLLWVQMSGGLIPYFATGVEVSRIEAARTLRTLPDPRSFPSGDAEQIAALFFWVFWAVLPLSAIAAFAARATMTRTQVAVIVGVIVTTVAANATFLRDTLDARVPDAIVGPLFLLAMTYAMSWQRRNQRGWRVLQIVLLVLMVSATVGAARVGRLHEQLDRAEVYRGMAGVRERAAEVIAELRAPYAEQQMPSDLAFALVPFYQYVNACTPPEARIFVSGLASEVPYYAHRGFAGGHTSLYANFHSSPEQQQLTIARLSRQLVPFVVVAPDAMHDFQRYGLIAAYVADHYQPLTDLVVEGFDDPAHILVRRNLPSPRTYGPDRWPCFR